MAGFFLGTVTALAISPAIMVASSWDAIFHFFSVAGAAVLALWLLFAEDLPPHPPNGVSSVSAAAATPRPPHSEAGVTPIPGLPSTPSHLPATGRPAATAMNTGGAERLVNGKASPCVLAGAGAAPSRSETVALMARMLCAPGAWAIFGLHFLHSVGSYIALSWLPTYLEQRWGG